MLKTARGPASQSIMKPEWESAIRRGDVAAARALLDKGIDIDSRDRHGQTALMRAAYLGYRDMVEFLVIQGADLNVTAKYRLSALMLAVIAGYPEIARILARAGADRTMQGSGAPGFADKTAYDLAVSREMNEILDELK
ncbi:MAG TPA: ankyrin repeat domain-containing protein [bacterium]|nr:ankyrin repeat domain-containing protein [bacterium]